nr:MAG TPA: leucine rich repeat protein [Caudoviricetes sp.]
MDPENKNFILEDGILYNKDKSKIILVTCDVELSRISDTVTEIGAGAFAFNKYTGELTIPSSVKKIGYLAFAYSKFSSIKFEDNIDNITFEKTGNNILYIFNTV